MEKYGFVYIWYDRKRKMYYIGCHWGSVEDGYICSSNRMRDAYKRRPQDFKRRILLTNIQTRDETLEKEHQLFFMIKEEELGTKYYNLRKHKWGHWVTDENSKLKVGEKISKSRTGKKYSSRGPRPDEVKKKISESLMGRPLSPENIAKRIATNTGKKKGPYKKHEKVSCPCCGFFGGVGAMKRFHFDNCKELLN